jgi:hypothetical protein
LLRLLLLQVLLHSYLYYGHGLRYSAAAPHPAEEKTNADTVLLEFDAAATAMAATAEMAATAAAGAHSQAYPVMMT